MRIAVTGSNGFVGKSLVNVLVSKHFDVVPLVRFASGSSEKTIQVGDITSKTNWKPYLNGIDCVIHCAGLAHDINNSKQFNINSYQETNVLGTINLAEQAKKMGVKKIIYLSSIKVNGDSTVLNKPFLIDDLPNPIGIYASSKWEAEKKLMQLSDTSDLDVVTIRAPLIYGPGVKANFYNLLRAVYIGMPLPLRSVNNQRSFVSIDNLISLILSCINKTSARGNTFFVSDDFDVSTSFLIECISKNMSLNSKSFSFPVNFLKVAGSLIGKRKLIESLVDSLQVDITYTKEVLDWEPEYPFKDCLNKTVKSFLETQNL
tara:strand:- start:10793 stop:11743 length:951 start_codon:yes stop_codon:yes gene_type:complete